MQVSFNWLSELVDLSQVGGPEGLAALLTGRGLEVEEVRSLAQGFDHVVTAQILKKDRHPQADRLSVCLVTLGQGEPLEIVCGAQNMKAGDKVALAQIGAQLPNGVRIEQSKIRGVVSNGMLCSEEELKLKESSEGILILPESTPLGRPLAEVLGLNDAILTLKLTANRGDCMSHFGLARDIAAALGQKPKRPEAPLLNFSETPISIHLEAGDQAPQFYGCLIEGVKVGPSPEWVVKRLEALGSRSINNVVDATNLVMLELGHPVHAYDADRIEGKRIRVRMAKEGETLPLLDGTEVKLAGTELTIADGKRAIGLAGVMGGGNSEVEDGTTRVFLECAEFDPVLVRRAAARHAKRTEASSRFEKGVDPLALPLVISRLAALVVQLAGGKVSSASRVVLPSRDPSKSKLERRIQLDPAYIGAFLGMKIAPERVESILSGLDCRIEKESPRKWTVIAPSYRRDLGIKEDLAEEVARTVGYDEIPSTIPVLTSAPEPQPRSLVDQAKDALVDAGLLEAVNMGFTSSKWLAQLGLKSTVRIQNPLSEEQEYMVPSLLPGLIGNALDNWRHHFGSEKLAIRLFEIRPTFHLEGDEVLAKSDTETNIREQWKISFVLSGPRYASALRNEQGELDFFDVKGVVERLFEGMGTRGIRWSPLSTSKTAASNPMAPLFHPGQSVEILAGNTSAGFVGMLHPRMAKELKTRDTLWIGELDWDSIQKLSRAPGESRQFKPWSEFPPMERDFALLVNEATSADKITQVALKAGRPLAKVAKIFDVYRGAQVVQGMTSVAVRVIFFEEGRSLQEAETEAASTRILEAWKKELGAELRG